MSVTIYGYSDDLIEIDGDFREEFAASTESDDGDVIGFSNGVLLRIHYANDGIWRITPISAGDGKLKIEQAPADVEDNYSDRATIDAEVSWILVGDRFEIKKK